MSELTKSIGQNEWQTEVLEAETPVLVDFWAEWCGPCKAIAPTLELIASEQQGKLKIVKVNVDEESGLAQQFGIRSIPTMVVMNKGEEVDRLVGALSKPQLEQKLAPHIG